MKRFWTADTHFGHANIVKYCERPTLKKKYFDENMNWVSDDAITEAAEDMNNFLIGNINSRVKDDDMVVCVGDFLNKGPVRGLPGLRKKVPQYMEQLNGNWFIVKGNHDPNNGVKFTPNFMEVKIGPYKAFVSHFPIEYKSVHGNDLYDYVLKNTDFQITGHVHKAWKYKLLCDKKKNYLMYNVGVDVRKYMPITDDELIGDYERVMRDLTLPPC